jgi:hypothetical protein
MNERGTYTRRVESFGRGGGLWTGVIAVLSGVVVIVLAILFSALFLALFIAIAVGVVVRSWLLGRRSDSPARPGVIDAEYTVIDSGEEPERRTKP